MFFSMHGRSGNAADRPRDSGQAMVEGAFVLLLIFVLLFGIFEGGRVLQVRQALTDAAREGARRSIAPFTQTSTLASPADVEGVVRGYLSAAHLDDTVATITVNRPVFMAGDPVTEYTRVTVTYPYRIMTILMFGTLNIDLTGSSVMRNETSP